MIGDMYPFSTRRYILFLSTIYYWRSIALDLFYSQSKKVIMLIQKKKKKKKKIKKKEKNMLMQSRSSLFVSNSYNHASRHAYDIYI